MSIEEQKRLIDDLSKAHLSLRAILDGVDLEKSAYEDASWRIRDIIGHVATWERVSAKSLRAYITGSEYVVPNSENYEDEYNEGQVLAQQKLSPQELLTEFEMAHDDFINALQEIPLERFPGDFLYPWGGDRGDIATMVEEMIEHVYEHRDEIIRAVKKDPNS